MRLRSKRTIAIGATVALAAVGGGVAVAATNGDDPRDEILSDAAKRLDVSPEELRSALQGAFEDQVDDAVAAGRLTEEQGERAKQMLRRHGVPLGGPGPRGHTVRIHGPIGPGLDAAAEHLGLTRAELGRRLANGSSLAEIARAQGKSVDGLEDALVAAAQEQLERAVADGDLTAAQRDRMLEQLREHVGDLVARELPDPPAGGPGFGGPHVRRFGGPPPGGPSFRFGEEPGERFDGEREDLQDD